MRAKDALLWAMLASPLVGCAQSNIAGESHPAPPEGVVPVTLDARADGSISGAIRHQRTGAPLARALVLLDIPRARPLEVLTDDFGRYRFDGLPPGTYTVDVLIGSARRSAVFALEATGRLQANFHVDPTAGPGSGDSSRSA